MEENTELNSQQPVNSTPEENGGQGEKLFTQADLDRIIGERLKRVKAEKQDTAELEAREKALASLASSLKCREYILDRGYPAELLDVIDTKDAEEFKKRADKICSVFSGLQTPATPTIRWPRPMRDTEPALSGDRGSIQSAFSPGRKHTPRDYLPDYEE